MRKTMNSLLLVIVGALALGGPAPELWAQDKKNKPAKKGKAKKASARPKIVIYSVDFFQLKLSTNIDGSESSKELGADHQYGPAGLFSAFGRTKLGGDFKVKENYLFAVRENRAIVDVKYVFNGGKLLQFNSSGGSKKNKINPRGRLSIRRPLDELNLGLRFGKAAQAVRELPGDDVNKHFRSLPKDHSFQKNRAREAIFKSLQLTILKDVERSLLKWNALAAKDSRGRSLTMKSNNAEVGNYVKFLSGIVKAELWWTCEIRYDFIFGSLGLGADDGPESAFVPGALLKGVGKIAVGTIIEKGAERVLWYRLPGFNVDKHTIEKIKLPAGWMMRFFQPGPRSRGALIFVKVPAQAAGQFDFTWRKNDASGSAVIINRPTPRKYPF
jgi:hypothetical protein